MSLLGRLLRVNISIVNVLLVLFYCNTVHSHVLNANDDNVLHIGGIFPIGGEGGWQGGQVIALK